MRSVTQIPLPPADMQSGVGGVPDAATYLDIGYRVKEALLERTGLKPTDHILDIGCGSGRVARYFVDYVRSPGRYVGVDIMKAYVDWCAENIAPANPTFDFHHQDIYNGYYNPEGQHLGSEYSFPLEDESFDVIFLASVFTHLLPEDALNYLKEISRLLKPGGRCFSTWFLLGHDLETNQVGREAKEERIEYGFRYCIEMLEQSGLTIIEEPTLGDWRGKGGPLALPLDQDLLMLGRATDTSSSLLSRYDIPSSEDLNSPQLEKDTGRVESFDPIRYALTVEFREGNRTFQIASDASISVNWQEANSRALRKDQVATLQIAGERESGAKVFVSIQSLDRPQVEKLNGIIEFVDLEHGLITLNYEGDAFKTFVFDPEKTTVRVRGKVANPSELQKGQRASIHSVSSVRAMSGGKRAPTLDEPPR